MSGRAATLSFPAHARAVSRSLRVAFAELLASIGADPADPQAISRSCALNKNLAWKVSKIVLADDPSVALTQMPGAAGVRIFLHCMEQAGASGTALAAARDAVREYEQLIHVHSGDRATLEIMGRELSPAGRQQRDEYHRRLLFQGASYVWGAQVRVLLKVGLVGPGHATGLLDFASLSGLIDFRRLRPDVTWVMVSRYSKNDDGTEMPVSAFEAVDERFAWPQDPPLIADFCSQPVPTLRRYQDAVGTTFALAEGPVGNTGALTCVAGTIQRHVPYYRTPENEWGEHEAMIDTPARLLILDLFIHEQFQFAMQPEAILCSQLRPPAPGRGRDRLPLNEPLQDLGASARLPPTPEVRTYGQMVQRVFERMGWSPADFRGFRLKMAFPPCPASFIVRYPLPEAESAGG